MTLDAARRAPGEQPGRRTTSADGIDLIKRFESLRLAPYHDDVGYPTVGYGHLLSKQKWADLSQWPVITEREADDILAQDLGRFERAVSRLVRVPLTEGQFSALVSFSFNLGSGALQASTLRRTLNRGEYHTVPTQLMRWVFAGGRKLRGLVRRREAEAILGMMWSAP